MSENVLADAQFGISSILRPFSGFEGIYQGQACTTPLMFTQGGEALDPLAGTPGYSPKLVRGLSVPYGARVSIWLPAIVGSKPLPSLDVWYYHWVISWRLRNVYDFRQRRIPFHYPKQGPGQPDTLNPAPTARVVIPAASNPIIYTQTQSSPTGQDITSALATDVAASTAINRTLPLLPDGTLGYFQQGVLNPATWGASGAGSVLYIPYEVQAQGDELLIGVSRSATADSPVQNPDTEIAWGFAAGEVDARFSDMFGVGSGSAYEDVGVYVLAGSAP